MNFKRHILKLGWFELGYGKFVPSTGDTSLVIFFPGKHILFCVGWFSIILILINSFHSPRKVPATSLKLSKV